MDDMRELGALLRPMVRFIAYWVSVAISLFMPLSAFVFSISDVHDVAHTPSMIEKLLLERTGSSEWTFVQGSAVALLAVIGFFVLFHMLDGRGATAASSRFEGMGRLIDTRSGGILVPSMLSAGFFFLALFGIAALYKVNGAVVTQFDFDKAVREAFPLYLASISVLAVVQLYYESNRMTYGVHEFLDAVTRDLRYVEKESGRVQFALQWLAVGQMSVSSDVFERYRDAFCDCCDDPHVEMRVKSRHWAQIETDLQVLENARPDLSKKISEFRNAESDVRKVLNSREHRNCEFKEVDDSKFANFGTIVFPSCIYFVYIDSGDARNAGSVTEDFIAIRVVDSEACRRFGALLVKD